MSRQSIEEIKACHASMVQMYIGLNPDPDLKAFMSKLSIRGSSGIRNVLLKAEGMQTIIFPLKIAVLI